MFIGLGRRKEAKARVKFIEGSGQIFINGRNTNVNIEHNHGYQSIIFKLLSNSSLPKKYDIIISVHGGGVKGQIDAIQLGMAKALCQLNPSDKSSLKTKGFLKYDLRSKERRKYGLKKARKAPQFSKR